MQEIKSTFENNRSLPERLLKRHKQLSFKKWVGWAGGYGKRNRNTIISQKQDYT